MQDELLRSLTAYRELWDGMGEPLLAPVPQTLARFRDFVASGPDCGSRSRLEGHVTASALVTDETFSRVLLTHHRKLNKWLQLGGHVDPGETAAMAAQREVLEESGLEAVRFTGPLASDGAEPVPLDLDIHPIPARPDEPAHLHYDVRYLLVTTTPDAIRCSEESHALRWFTLPEAMAHAAEESMHRQFRKLAHLRSVI